MWLDDNFYPTPYKLVDKLLSNIDIRKSDVLAEPSAGKGDIALELRRRYPNNQLWCVEIDPNLVRQLRRHDLTVIQASIFDLRLTADVIVCNPPFRENFQDIDHIMWYWSLLRTGGRIAGIIHEYSAFPKWDHGKPYEFRRFLDIVGATVVKNPPGSFSTAERPTHTSTAMFWAQKTTATY